MYKESLKFLTPLIGWLNTCVSIIYTPLKRGERKKNFIKIMYTAGLKRLLFVEVSKIPFRYA